MALLTATAACADDGPVAPETSFSIEGPTSVSVVVGDSVYFGTSPTRETVVWSAASASVASVDGGAVAALRPGTTYVIARTGDAADSVAVTVTPRPGGYTAEEIDYFTEIALGFEYGGASHVIRRWGEPIRYRLYGAPDAEDRASLARVVSEINALTGTVDMVEVTEDPLVEIHFAPVADFPDILPSYVSGNIGYFAIWYAADHHFTRAVVLIASDREREVRDHLIREEVTQILGLGRDSERYPESIFYQRWSLVSEYAPVDRALVEMLYRPEVHPGMDEDAVSALLRRLTREGASTVPLAPLAPSVAQTVRGTGAVTASATWGSQAGFAWGASGAR